MWGFLGNLPKLVQAIIALVAIVAAALAVVLVAFLVNGDPYRGISLPGGFQITARQDPGLVKCQAAFKALSDITAAFAKTTSDLIAEESSEAERVSTLRRKYLDDNIVEQKPAPPGSGGPTISSFLPDTVKEYQNVVAAREAAQKQQGELSTKADEANRICGGLIPMK